MHSPVLAIETIGAGGSIAVADGERLLLARPLDERRRSAQTLSPAVAEVLREVGWRPADLRLIAVVVGPGSFTGLRVGVVTAKTLAYAVGAACVGLGSLETIAAQAPDDVAAVEVAIDAGRGEVYSAAFQRAAEGALVEARPTIIESNEVWLERLRPGAVVSGPALAKLAARLPGEVRPLDAALWGPQAATAARLAWGRFQRGAVDDVWRLAPVYVRRSAAEEKRDARS